MKIYIKGLFALIISYFFCSCTVKTFTVSESDIVGPVAYNLSQDSADWSTCPDSIKNKWLNIAVNIVNTEDSVVYDSDSVEILRKFVKLNDSIITEYFTYVPSLYRQTIVFFIGNNSRHTGYTDILTKLAVSTNSKIVSWNYRGYGKSSGVLSFKTQFADNKAIFEKIGCGEENMPLIIMGFSIGSVFACDLATKEQLDRLVLLSPLSSVDDWLTYNKECILSGWKMILRPFVALKTKQGEDYVTKISNLDKVIKFDKDLLIVQAKDDTMLPYFMGQKLFEVSKSKHKQFITLEEGDHGAPLANENLGKIINWINN